MLQMNIKNKKEHLLLTLLVILCSLKYLKSEYCTSQLDWEAFKVRFNKNYSDSEENQKRYEIWVENIQEINSLISSEKYNFEIAINEFADLVNFTQIIR